MEAIDARFIALMQAGVSPTSEPAREVAEAHRRHIDRWFYPCSPEMHRQLAQMYVDDPRFAANYDNKAKGLAEFVRDAVVGDSPNP